MSDLHNLREKQVLAKCGIAHATMWRLIQTNEFPAPRRISKRAIAWVSTEIDEWILNRPLATDI